MFNPFSAAFQSDASLTKQEWLFGMVLQGLCANPRLKGPPFEEGILMKDLIEMATGITETAIESFNESVKEPHPSVDPTMFEWNWEALRDQSLIGKPDPSTRLPT